MPESLKKGWTRVAFGEMVTHIAERVEPTPEDGEKYVGLEHLDSGSLTVRRWGVQVALIGTKLRMRKGDILFARRNAYLRRVAIAPHDGLFSAHGMIVRAKPAVLLPEFLPFFMQSNAFMDRAEHISVGSLSPTINWKTLVQEEFALPPLDEQRRIAEVLGAFRSTIESMRTIEESIFVMNTSWLEAQMRKADLVCPLGDVLLSTEYGCSSPSNEEQEGLPILRIPNVLRDELDLNDLKWVQLPDDDIQKYLLRPDDILIVRTNGNPAYVGRCLVVPHLPERMVYASYLIRLVVDPRRARPEYVACVLNSPRVRRDLRRSVRSSAGNFNINTEGIRGVRVPVPSIADQDWIIEKAEEFKRLAKRCAERSHQLADSQRIVMGELVS